jgi:hypothetical protein
MLLTPRALTWLAIAAVCLAGTSVLCVATIDAYLLQKRCRAIANHTRSVPDFQKRLAESALLLPVRCRRVTNAQSPHLACTWPTILSSVAACDNVIDDGRVRQVDFYK